MKEMSWVVSGWNTANHSYVLWSEITRMHFKCFILKFRSVGTEVSVFGRSHPSVG